MGNPGKTCLVCKSTQRSIFRINGYDYRRCFTCGLVSTHPYPSKKEILKHYEKNFKTGNYQLLKKYNKQYRNVYKQFSLSLKSYLKEIGFHKSNPSILDVGCFTGDFLEIMRNDGYDVYGIELQKDAVNRANKKLKGRVKNADIMSKNIIKKRFDIVTMLGLIEHVVKPQEFITRAYELLNTGGILFIQTPNSNSTLAKILRKYWPPYSPVEHIHIFSENSIKILLKNAKFENTKIKRHIKKLPVSYVYNNFQNFGPHFYKLLKPLGGVLNKVNLQLPFYVGEIMVFTKKK